MAAIFPRWIEHFLDGRPVVAAGREQLPQNEREFLDLQGIMAICVHPVSAGGELLGFLGFDIVAGPSRTGFEGWSTPSVEALATGAHLLGAALRMEASRARLNQALVDAERANRAKSDFLASMSHDLRTPLNAIIGFADLMLVQAPGMPGKQAEYLTDIRDAGRHLLEMIDDILDLSKIEAGRMILREEAVDPETLVDGVVRLMQARIAANALTLDRGDRRYGWALTCDPRLVRQMLLNLVGNAVKFTPDGGTLTITCEPGADGGMAIAVRDTGPGMSAAQLAQALRPFETADARVARPSEANGTGLGLFLVDRMMRLHGGALAIDTAPGQGLTARLIFPAERCLTPEERAEDPADDA
ncbi:MAG: hypothetical protein GVY28_14435 [Alphaproteobacteria bacterium]|nr:hypothetical protein [Alphaproteobacteria bacterium]